MLPDTRGGAKTQDSGFPSDFQEVERDDVDLVRLWDVFAVGSVRRIHQSSTKRRSVRPTGNAVATVVYASLNQSGPDS